jgi:hypothetical protein
MTEDEARVWRRIFAVEAELRWFPLVLRCRILAEACTVDELPRLAKLVAETADAYADMAKSELR